MSEQRIVCVTIYRVDGKQTDLDEDDVVWDSDGDRITLPEVMDALERGPYIDFETEARWEPSEAEESWKQPDPGDWHDASARVYSRHVTEVMEVYDSGV